MRSVIDEIVFEFKTNEIKKTGTFKIKIVPYVSIKHNVSNKEFCIFDVFFTISTVKKIQAVLRDKSCNLKPTLS